MPALYPPRYDHVAVPRAQPPSGHQERLSTHIQLVTHLNNHRLAEKQRGQLSNRIKYLNAQNSRVLRDLQAVHRTAQKLDNGRVRQMERRLHEEEVRTDRMHEYQDKALLVANRRQRAKEMKWKLGGDNEQRLNRIKDAKDKRCTDLRKNTDDVEVNIVNLEQEEKMCVERLTYSKMMSQRVLYQLERNIGTQTASLSTLDRRGQKDRGFPPSGFQPPQRVTSPPPDGARPSAAGFMMDVGGIARGMGMGLTH
jgi:hypothetical protein